MFFNIKFSVDLIQIKMLFYILFVFENLEEFEKLFEMKYKKIYMIKKK